MSKIDIRNMVVNPIDTIVFADEGVNYITAASLKHLEDHFYIFDEDGKDSVIVESVEQTENLIKALQKAIELKWVS